MCFFFNDTATTEIYTLSLHDALPIYLAGARIAQTQNDAQTRQQEQRVIAEVRNAVQAVETARLRVLTDRKSTRLNSSHANISYAVFCLKKKKYTMTHHTESNTKKLTQ